MPACHLPAPLAGCLAGCLTSVCTAPALLPGLHLRSEESLKGFGKETSAAFTRISESPFDTRRAVSSPLPFVKEEAARRSPRRNVFSSRNKLGPCLLPARERASSTRRCLNQTRRAPPTLRSPAGFRRPWRSGIPRCRPAAPILYPQPCSRSASSSKTFPEGAGARSPLHREAAGRSPGRCRRGLPQRLPTGNSPGARLGTAGGERQAPARPR